MLNFWNYIISKYKTNSYYKVVSGNEGPLHFVGHKQKILEIWKI